MSSSSDVTDAVAMEEDLGRVEKLEKLLRALQDIKRENVRLRDNFSELQGVHRELRESNAELEEENTAIRSDGTFTDLKSWCQLQQANGRIDVADSSLPLGGFESVGPKPIIIKS